MKALFLIFHSFYPASGISKKISAQVDALKKHGIETELCYVFEENGYKQRRVDDKIIRDYGNGIKGKILKRLEFSSVTDYIIKNKINLLYMRSAHNAHPLTIHMLKQIHNAGIKIVMEIPTYPYDREYDSLIKKIELFPDKCFRNKLVKYIDYIITFSNENIIFGKPTIQISNGIDFSKIAMKKTINSLSHEMHFIGVAEIHYWHGFDRFINGLGKYHLTNPEFKIYFHLVGNFFSEKEKNVILPLISKYKLENYVILHGLQQEEKLDELFELADMAIGSLGRHRSGISNIKTLKNREYAARGIPFIYSENDSDFDNKSYIMKVPADESAINILEIISFRKTLDISPAQIRESIGYLSWDKQIDTIMNTINK